jgi:hypothetical protein
MAMKQAKKVLLLVMIGVAAGGAVPFVAIGQTPIFCAPPHRLGILGLGMVPDPVRQGQRIQLWTVALQSDYNGECRTLLEVRDGDQLAGAAVEYLIKPGVGRYTFQAVPGYRFQRQNHCFLVRANIGNTWTPIVAKKAFCAHRGPGGWSLQ